MEEILAKYFAQEATEEECRKVEEWRNHSVENSMLFLSYKKTWADTLKVEPERNILELLRDEPTKVIPIWRRSWFKYAASIVLVIGATLAFYFNQNLLISNTTGLAKDVRLDDGTVVTLYKDAILEELSMGDERKVRVEGKVFFDVKEDKNRPFIILTEEARVEVLGTSFLVNSSEKYTTEVIVESGLVSFSHNPEKYKKASTYVRLAKGEKGIISPRAKGIIKQNNRDENYLAWKTQILTFKQNDLDYVAGVIEEVYGYKVEFENPKLTKCKLTARYNRKSPEEIAKLIANTFGISYVVTETNSIHFSGQECN